MYALAHATGKTGRFTLIERWRNNERLLAPQEHPLKVREQEREREREREIKSFSDALVFMSGALVAAL